MIGKMWHLSHDAGCTSSLPDSRTFSPPSARLSGSRLSGSSASQLCSTVVRAEMRQLASQCLSDSSRRATQSRKVEGLSG